MRTQLALVALLVLGVCGMSEAQTRIRTLNGGVRVVDRMPTPPAPPIPHVNPPIPNLGRPCLGPQPYPGYLYGGYPYVNDYGWGPYGYGSSVGYYGPYGWGAPWGVSSYSSISYGFPGLTVGYVAPIGGGYGYGAPWVAPPIRTEVFSPPAPPPLSLPQWMWDEAGLGQGLPSSRERSAVQPHPTLIPPSSPEAQLRSVRLQEAGDRLFQRLDYAAAAKSYAAALKAAPDRPDPYLRLAITRIARKDFRQAITYLRTMIEIDPSYPSRAVSLGEMFGNQNGISRLQLKQGVADWTNADVRDPERLFLLGVVLFLEGDERFKTILDTAVKLEGEKPYLTAFRDSPPANSTPIVVPRENGESDTNANGTSPTAVSVPVLPESARPPLSVPVPEP